MTIRYLSLAGAAARLGISPHTARDHIEAGRFPAPDALTGDGTRAKAGWLPETIDTWDATRQKTAGRPKGSIKQQQPRL